MNFLTDFLTTNVKVKQLKYVNSEKQKYHYYILVLKLHILPVHLYFRDAPLNIQVQPSDRDSSLFGSSPIKDAPA